MIDKEMLELILKEYDVEKSFWNKWFGDPDLIKALKIYNESTSTPNTDELLNIIFVEHQSYWGTHKISKQVLQLIANIIYRFIPCNFQISFIIIDEIINVFSLLAINNIFDLSLVHELLEQPHHHQHLSLCASKLNSRQLLSLNNFYQLQAAIDTAQVNRICAAIDFLNLNNILTQETLDLTFKQDPYNLISIWGSLILCAPQLQKQITYLATHPNLSALCQSITELEAVQLNSESNINRLLLYENHEHLSEVIHILFCCRQLSQRYFDTILNHHNIEALATAVSRLYPVEPMDNAVEVKTIARASIGPATPQLIVPLVLDTLFSASTPIHLADAYVLANEQGLLNKTLVDLICKYPHHVFTAVTLTLYISSMNQTDYDMLHLHLNLIRDKMNPDHTNEQYYRENTILHKFGYHLLAAAVIDNRTDLVRKFLDMKMPLNPPEIFLWQSKTPLTLSVLYNHPDLTSIFLHAGVNQNQFLNATPYFTNRKMSLLEYAREKNLMRIQNLLEVGPKKRYIKQLYALAEALINLGFLGFRLDATTLADMLTPFLPTPYDCNFEQSRHITRSCFNYMVGFFQAKKLSTIVTIAAESASKPQKFSGTS